MLLWQVLRGEGTHDCRAEYCTSDYPLAEKSCSSYDSTKESQIYSRMSREGQVQEGTSAT